MTKSNAIACNEINPKDQNIFLVNSRTVKAALLSSALANDDIIGSFQTNDYRPSMNSKTKPTQNITEKKLSRLHEIDAKETSEVLGLHRRRKDDSNRFAKHY